MATVDASFDIELRKQELYKKISIIIIEIRLR